MRTQSWAIEDFSITIGLHQGLTLSFYLFIFIIDVLTEHMEEVALRCMLFADGNPNQRVEGRNKWERRRQVLEKHDCCLSRSKTKYMKCKFSKRLWFRCENWRPYYTTSIKYLRFMIQNDRKIKEDFNYKISSVYELEEFFECCVTKKCHSNLRKNFIAEL